MSIEPIPDGGLAAVCTYLEMRTPPDAGPLPESPLTLSPLLNLSLDQYRALYRKVGGRWLWYLRLIMDDAALSAFLRDPAVELRAVIDEVGVQVGMVELDYRVAGECELAYLGLVPELAGQGHGKWLLAQALRLAWREGISRIHLHTGTFDHPAAIRTYRRVGFVPFKLAIERFPDPRLTGLLPRDCAPQIPLLERPSS